MNVSLGHIFHMAPFLGVYKPISPEGQFRGVNNESLALVRCPNKIGQILRVSTFPPALAKQGLWEARA
ncbi:hypothetical protein BD01_1548 [Thermococcus nautili]|uniref:Uncharacterized protein n=1 Tax=Thermococcus nautili TaxID=195522 RepID=W8P2Y5_9EURY|nr:hypothetical protein BD01_1548 [Thermococcus nautili]